MRKLLIVLIAGFVIGCADEREESKIVDEAYAPAPSHPGAEPNEPTLRHCLVGYYPFNGNANDESGNGHHGTVHGPTLTMDRHGNPNAAYHFDGNSDSIWIADDPDFHFKGSFSVSMWVREEYWTPPYEYWGVMAGYGPSGGSAKWICPIVITMIDFLQKSTRL